MSKHSMMRGNDFNRDRDNERMRRVERRANRERNRRNIPVANRYGFR